MAKSSGQKNDKEVLDGLLVRGVVQRRWRKVLDSGVEVVFYDLGSVLVQQYKPEGAYLAIGAEVELNVQVQVFQSKNGARYSLVLESSKQEGEF